MWDLEIQGKTAVCVAVDGAIRGILGLADTAKAEAFSTIKALQAMGLDVWMVSFPCS
jgi:Cu+-exporting ATPase